MVVVLLILTSLILAVIMQRRDRKRTAEQNGDSATRMAESKGGIKSYQVSIAVGIVTLIIAFWGSHLLVGLEGDAKVFPSTILLMLKIIAILMILKEVFFKGQRDHSMIFKKFQPLTLVVVASTVIYFPCAIFIGFYLSTFIFLMVIPIILVGRNAKFLMTKALPIAGGFTLVLYWTFHELLRVSFMFQFFF